MAKRYKITVIGTGYVGSGLAIVLAKWGHDVVGIDIREDIVERLNDGDLPIYEPGLPELLEEGLKNGNLKFTTDYEEGMKDNDAVFLCVGTPSKESGEPNLEYVFAATESIAEELKKTDKFVTVVPRSTVPVGTCFDVEEAIKKVAPDADFEIAFIPEYLRQGFALEDTEHPRSLDIGLKNLDSKVKDILLDIFYSVVEDGIPVNIMDIPSAEMAKLFANTQLASTIALAMDFASLCEEVGATYEHVRKSALCDKRVGRYIQATAGIGGSCFPKDVRDAAHLADHMGVKAPVMHSIIDVMILQPKRVVESFKKLVGEDLKGKKIGLLGLVFKPGTDDLRDSPSLDIAKILEKEGVEVHGYDQCYVDPKPMPKDLEGIKLHKDIDSLLKDIDSLILAVDWPEVKEYGLHKVAENMKTPVVYDTRNCWDGEEAVRLGIKYQGLGAKPSVK